MCPPPSANRVKLTSENASPTTCFFINQMNIRTVNFFNKYSTLVSGTLVNLFIPYSSRR